MAAIHFGFWFESSAPGLHPPNPCPRPGHPAWRRNPRPNRVPSQKIFFSFRRIQWGCLTRPKPQVTGMAMGSGELFGMLEHPHPIAYGDEGNVQFFVSRGHEFSIAIAIWILILAS
jgi:hypothetical protein